MPHPQENFDIPSYSSMVPVSEVAGRTTTCELPDVINCQFRKFTAAALGPVHFLSQDQESGIHCLII